MRFLIIDGDYPEYIRLLYEQNPGLKKLSYKEQLQFRARTLVGQADFYSTHLRELGHEAEDIWVNNEIIQRAWAKEHSVPVTRSWDWNFRLRRGLVPWLSRVPNKSWIYEVLGAQIRYYKPDVLLNNVMGFISASFLREMKPYIKLLVGNAAPVVLVYGQDPAAYRQAYDVVVSASEGMVDYFRSQGIKTELLRNAFEPRILHEVALAKDRYFAVSFPGLVRGNIYNGRLQLLEDLCSKFGKDMHVWATSLEGVPADSPIRDCYEGDAWGRELNQILSASKIVWNCHAEIAGKYADNYRLFEATGLGACLVTDWKVNLSDIFDVGKEILAYKSKEECFEIIRYCLDHDSEREAIAQAGQKRTLRDYTFMHRVQGLIEIADKYLRREPCVVAV
jgi:spore maturation protein CgeB